MTLSPKKIIIIKLILVFIAVAILTYSLLVVVKYQFFKQVADETGTVSLQYLAKKGSSDTDPGNKPATAEKSGKKSLINLEKQKSDSGGNQTSVKQGNDVEQPKKDNPIEPPVEVYAIQPIIFFGLDTSINAHEYQKQVDQNFAGIQSWYRDQLGGKTFTLLPAVLYRSALSEAELLNKYSGGIGMWLDGLGIATTVNNLELCSDHRFYYFVTPLDNVVGGMIGAENLGCDHVLPGTASIPNQMGRLIGGLIDPDWPEWWADEVREAQGGAAHEIGHGLGGICVEGVCNGLPHAEPGQDSIMFEWWTFGTTGIFLDAEKTQILKSSFIN